MEGKTVSHYRILEKIGEGGMGQVYLAEDTSLERKVALKFLPLGLQTDPVAHKRFVREAKSAAAIDHPYICNIHEVAQTEDGQDFIVMEYVEGQTLKDRLEKGQLPIKEALQIGSEVAEALEEAHNKGVIHRDLKPSNIMLTPAGHAKVLDFGLAKRVTRDKEDLTSVLTREGTTLGTLAYMSPEQLRGSTVDTRADVFSLGVVLYEMLTGVHPFSTGTQAETVNAILSEHPSTLSRYVEGVPDLLQHTIKKMLAKQPGERYQSVHEIRTNLTKVMEEITSPTPLAEPVVSRKGWLFGAVTAIIAIVVLASVWYYFFAPSAQESSAPLVPVPLTSLPGHESHPCFSPEGQRVAFVSGVYRGGGISIKQLGATEGEPLQLTESKKDSGPIWSPDGSSIYFVRALGDLWFRICSVPALGGTVRELGKIHMPGNRVAPYLRVTPDGKSLVVTGYPESDPRAGLFMLSLETQVMERLTTTPEDFVADFSPCFSPDGRTLAFARSAGRFHGDIYILSFDESIRPVGEPQPLLLNRSQMRGLAWSPNGEDIIYSSGFFPDWRIWRIKITEPENPKALGFAGTGVRFPSVSETMNRLAYQKISYVLNMYQVRLDESGTQIGTPESFQRSSRIDWLMDYSPDGSRVVFCSDRDGEHKLYVCDRDGSNATYLTSLSGTEVYEPCWSPDGNWIAFVARPDGDGEIFLVSERGGSPQRLTNSPYTDEVPSWSLDSHWVYFQSNRGGETSLWKIPVEGGEATETAARELGKSMDGEWIYYLGEAGVWKQSTKNGTQVPIPEVDGTHPQLVKETIYYVTEESSSFTIYRFDLETGEVAEVIASDKGFGWKFAVSPDGQSLLYGQVDQSESDLMLVENFR